MYSNHIESVPLEDHKRFVRNEAMCNRRAILPNDVMLVVSKSWTAYYHEINCLPIRSFLKEKYRKKVRKNSTKRCNTAVLSLTEYFELTQFGRNRTSKIIL